VTVDDEVYRAARRKAAERDTSLSALVAQYLTSLAAEESEPQRLRREERELRGRITTFRASNSRGREDLHDRGA